MPRIKVTLSYVVDVPDDIYAQNPDPRYLGVVEKPRFLFATGIDFRLGYYPSETLVQECATKEGEPYGQPHLSSQLSWDELIDQDHVDFDPEGVAAERGLLDEFYACGTTEHLKIFCEEKLGLPWPGDM